MAIALNERNIPHEKCLVDLQNKPENFTSTYARASPARAKVPVLEVGDDVLVGMGAVVMDLAEVGQFCIVGAAALVPLRMVVPDRSLVVGVPAKVRRSVTEEEIEHHIRHGHAEYLRLQAEYRAM